jgi:hypothetical protein
MFKFYIGAKVIGSPDYRKEFKIQISGTIVRVVLVDEQGAVVELKLDDGKVMRLDQDWLILDPCVTCALAKEGACIPAGNDYATNGNNKTEGKT